MGLEVKGFGATLTRANTGRWLRRAINRIRGDQNVEGLIAAGMEFGAGARVARGAYIDPGRPWLIKMGAQSGLSPEATVLTHDDTMKLQTGFTRIGRVEIGERVFVGTGAIILPGTRIGDGSIIGAGAVVRGEIPPDSLVSGHPARVITTVSRARAWQRRALDRSPIWPLEGWTTGAGITDERKASQREALATAREGYLMKPGRKVDTRSGGAE